MAGSGDMPEDPHANQAGTQQDLVDRLLALRGLAACRAFIAAQAAHWQAEAVTLLKRHCDQLLGTAPRRAIRAAHLCYLVAQARNDQPDIAMAERALAQSCHANGHYGFAVPLYARSAQRFERAGMPGQAGGSQAVLVDALMHLGRQQEALDLAADTRGLLASLGERRRVALLDANVGNGLFLLDRPREALEAYDRARALLSTPDENRPEPTAVGVVSSSQPRPEAGSIIISDVHDQQSIADEDRPEPTAVGVSLPSDRSRRPSQAAAPPPAQDELALARVEMSRANALAALDRPREAHAAFAAAMEHFATLGLSAYVGVTHFNQAYVHFLGGQYSEALAGLEEARTIFARLDDRQHLALCLVDEAEVLLALGRLDEAVSLADHAWTALRQIGLHHDAARARALGAAALVRLGRTDEALAVLAQARTVFGSEQNGRRLAMTYLTEAAILLRQGDGAPALQACEQARAALQEWPATLVAEEQFQRASALRSLGRRGAHAAARRSLVAARAAGTMFWSWQARHLLGQIAEATGDLEGAARQYRRAAGEVERARGAIPTEELRIAFQEDKHHLYEDMVLNALARNQPEEAFSAVERAKSRTLVDLMAGAAAVPRQVASDDAALARRIEALRSELTWLYNRLHDAVGGEQRRVPGSGLADLVDAVSSREVALQRALRRLRARHAEYVSLHSVETASLSDVQALLPAGTTLVEYCCLGDDVAVFLITASSVHVRRLVGIVPEVRRALRRWHLHISTCASGSAYVQAHAATLEPTARAILHDLHRLLMAPLAQIPAEADLLVVPHGLLHGVPFQALYDGRRHLIEERGISYAPSASVLRFCLTRKALTEGHTLVVGVPDERTPSIDAEVAAVASLFTDSTVLRGPAATGAALRERAATAARLHLATHAVFRADNPAFSAVRLADRWLTMHEIYDLDLQASLITLSGCETATVATQAAEELIGLTRGFLYAGTPTLVASMWVVDDAATATTMTAFYRGIQRGESPRAALRAAQLAGVYAGLQPYYWAPFVVIGRP